MKQRHGFFTKYPSEFYIAHGMFVGCILGVIGAMVQLILG
jgi:hypothetical protein